MLTSLIITFRETLEATLLIGIVLAYLSKIKQKNYFKSVYAATTAAVIISIVTAALLKLLVGEFTGEIEEIFEITVKLATTILISSLVFWMFKHSNVSNEIRDKIDKNIAKATQFGIFLLVFVNILREGIETVLFLFANKDNSLIGGSVGIIAAIIVGYLVFRGAAFIKLKYFFNITSILLVIFASSIFAEAMSDIIEVENVAIFAYLIYFAIMGVAFYMLTKKSTTKP